MGGFAFPNISTEPISGDSLTQFLRSMTNSTASGGQNLLNTGGDILSKPTNYYGGILAGNTADIMNAMSPEINAARAQYQAARRGVDQFAPMGGGRASTMASLPFQQAGTVSNIIAQARPQAANAMTGIGMGEQQIGLQALQDALNAILQRRGQNVQESGQNKSLAGQLGSSAIGALL